MGGLGCGQVASGAGDSFLFSGALSVALVEFLLGFRKPVMGSTFLDNTDSMVRDMCRGGIPMFPSPERAVKAMEALCRYRTLKDNRP